MSERRPASGQEIFQRRRAEALTQSTEALQAEVMLAVGYLMGRELDGPAAAVSVLIERAFPEQNRWLWGNTPEGA